MEENKILGIPSLTVEDLNKLAELKIDDRNLKRKIELMTYTAYYEMHEMDQEIKTAEQNIVKLQRMEGIFRDTSNTFENIQKEIEKAPKLFHGKFSIIVESIFALQMKLAKVTLRSAKRASSSSSSASEISKLGNEVLASSLFNPSSESVMRN
ncbi:Oidioi.mRNA.OKI2018_I69.XSR.g13542.t1.cds [Oikopleura dioica]|uniref:Oidioi.mRNA.OKI2018_I69.XSR.g13542.t1.cds n=1 Tax=Oikopleura dioica TaxID=34765 RepID=A0ABN7S766_OIKDI|nr:Oidioi.mRNA.OKI2018_I69.XSR.g13542.t1.cds [Oikopleura dioica]